ncbi:hypothetical protein RHGRI_030176 [Rhododendron griersonianum]|uniref:Scarecrow-like protein 9 n=1 Tax=Rhododendron griersonianum TaxID=479676 RepID=A0AAV6IRK3_9ERIC|nr:hypothetical protein RHGRI_030176 [Rhododendron griersonianum]
MGKHVQGREKPKSVNLFGFDHILVPSSSDHDLVNGIEFRDLIQNLPDKTLYTLDDIGTDVSEAVLNYISQMLMEDDDDDRENRPGLIEYSLALQAAEKSLYDVLHNPLSICENVDTPDDDFTRTCSSPRVNNSFASVDSFLGDSNSISDRNKLGFPRVHRNLDYAMQSNSKTTSSSSVSRGIVDSLVSSFQVLDPSKVSQASSRLTCTEHENNILEQNEKTSRVLSEAEKNLGEPLMCRSRGARNHCNKDGDCSEVDRSYKQLAGYDEDSNEQSLMYEVLLCPAMNPHLHKEESSARSLCGASSSGLGGKLQKNGQSKGSSGRKARGKNQGNKREVVDLVSLLTQCAQAVVFNSITAYELLKQIRQHSSPKGDGTERMAHYLAEALEARLAGTGRALDASFLSKRLTAAESLAAYLAYVKASPFRKMLNFFANKMIWKLSENATRIHIIDFGIIHGFQWPGLFQNLSQRPGGPPSVRLTGIDFPQPGFRPAERVEETGRRLAYYGERFNVPFEFNGVVKQWDTIRLEDLKIQRDEVLVVNCLNRMRYVSDDVTVDVDSPRDAVLKLINTLNPDLFIHGIVNGSYSAPFFASRFRELLFHSHAAFDMFDAILPLEHEGRMLYERDVLGRAAMSVVACEGTERIIRPETYKQWQIRNTRAGLKQLPLDHDIVEDVRAKVKYQNVINHAAYDMYGLDHCCGARVRPKRLRLGGIGTTEKMLMLFRKASSCTRITVLAKLKPEQKPSCYKPTSQKTKRLPNTTTGTVGSPIVSSNEYFSADTNVISKVEQGKIRFAFKETHDVDIERWSLCSVLATI